MTNSTPAKIDEFKTKLANAVPLLGYIKVPEATQILTEIAQTPSLLAQITPEMVGSLVNLQVRHGFGDELGQTLGIFALRLPHRKAAAQAIEAAAVEIKDTAFFARLLPVLDGYPDCIAGVRAEHVEFAMAVQEAVLLPQNVRAIEAVAQRHEHLRVMLEAVRAKKIAQAKAKAM